MSARQFLYSLTCANGLVQHGTFDGILTGDLPASGVTAGSYTNASITVDAHGLVTAASSGSAGNFKGVEVALTSNQSINNAVTSVIVWDASAVLDQNSYFNSGTNYITAANTGWHIISCHIKWAGSATGKRVMDIRINASNFLGSTSALPTASGNDPDMATSVVYYLTARDIIECTVFQNSGGALNVTAAQMQMLEIY